MNGAWTKQNARTRAGVISSLMLAVWLFPQSTVLGQLPHLIRYQGQAVDAQGVPLEGPYTLTFRLYDAETAGTKVWEERQADVVLTGGHFSVLLGQVTPFAVDWSTPLWLSVQVGTEPELAPRQRITSVPLAIRADIAEGLTSAITPALISPQGSGSGLDADTVDGKQADDLVKRTNHTGTQSPSTIHPQGSDSGLDADTVDGQQAADLLARANHTGTQPSSTITGTFAPSVISPQGSGSGLGADSLDGKDSSAFAMVGHRHTCVNRMNMGSGQTGNSFCAGYGEWCAHNLTAGGRDTESCTTANPGFGDWGAVCCQ